MTKEQDVIYVIVCTTDNGEYFDRRAVAYSANEEAARNWANEATEHAREQSKKRDELLLQAASGRYAESLLYADAQRIKSKYDPNLENYDLDRAHYSVKALPLIKHAPSR